MSIYQPYFYIIQETSTEIYYAGAKWGYGSNPHEFMTEDGYKTSSKIINELISKNGLETFVIRKIVTFDSGEDALAYETKFLNRVNAKNNPFFYNQHNNGFPIMSDKTKKQLSLALKGKPKSIEHREKISKGNKGKKRTETMKENNRRKMSGRKLTEDHKEKIKQNGRSGTQGKMCITNGELNIYIDKNSTIPHGFRIGMVKNEGKTRFINNGINNKRIPLEEELPFGWVEGIFKKKEKRVWITNGKDSRLIKECEKLPFGWKKGRN